MARPPVPSSDFGADLCALIKRLGSPPVDIRHLTTQPHALSRRASWKLHLADGRVLKARRLESAERGAVLERLASLTERLPLSPVVARRGDALLEAWVPGPGVDTLPMDLDLAEALGSLLGTLAVTGDGSPMATATAMYHSGRNPLKGLSRDPAKVEKVDIVRGERRRRLHKAFLRYHDAANWPLLREALAAMGRSDLIGNGKHHLIPTYQPGGGIVAPTRRDYRAPVTSATPAPVKAVLAKPPRRGTLLTQHSGLPPRETGSARVVRAAGARTSAGRKPR